MTSFKKGRRRFFGGKGRKDASEAGQDETLPFSDSNLALSPSSFTSIHFYCERYSGPTRPTPLTKEYELCDLAALNDDESFANCYLGWGEEGLWFSCRVNQALSQSFYPEIAQGDSVELFIDTRDIKTSGFNTRFCHHFFFLPEESNGHIAGELTRFRTEDVHEWCDAKELRVHTDKKSSHYQLSAFIPEHCLHGFDPIQFDRIGFTYRINRCMEAAQHFSVSSNDYSIEQQPSLWASVRLLP